MRWVTWFLLGAGVVFVACSGADDTADITVPENCVSKIKGDVYVGGLLPFTGSWPVGEGFDRAILQALGEINAAGGVDGPTVGYISCNTDGDKTTGTDQMKTLGQIDQLSAVIGPGRSVVMVGGGPGETAAASQAIASRRLMLSPGATSPLISELDDNGYVFRTVVSDAVQGAIIAKIAEREGFKRVFVAEKDADAYSLGIREVFVASFAGKDGQTAEVFKFDAASPDFASSTIDAAVSSGAEAIVFATLVTEAAALIKEAGTRTWPDGMPKLIAPDGVKDDTLITNVANNALLEGLKGTFPAAPTGTNYDLFAAVYRRLYDEEPRLFAANAYDAAYLIGAAMVLADDPTSGEQLKQQILNTQPGEGVESFGPGQWVTMLAELKASGKVNYEGASGALDFDQNGDVSSNIAEWAIEAGEIKVTGCWTAEGSPCE